MRGLSECGHKARLRGRLRCHPEQAGRAAQQGLDSCPVAQAQSALSAGLWLEGRKLQISISAQAGWPKNACGLALAP